MSFYLFKLALGLPVLAAGLYAGLLFALTKPLVQAHAVYLHAFQMTGGKDLQVPEMFGFLRGQVTPFTIPSFDGTLLHAWHILPVGKYLANEDRLCEESRQSTSDITTLFNFQLLRNDPEARLVIHFHGAGGNIASGYRVPNYKALSAAQPHKVHVLAFDYRGFGLTVGNPSEDALIQDAIAVVNWALHVAQVDPERILIFSQSMGTAVNMAVAERLALEEHPVALAGHIFVAPFVDVATLVTTYRIAGIIPILSPVAKYPILFNWLKTYIRDNWATNKRVERYVQTQEAGSIKYRLTMIHAEDDYDIPWQHTPILFWHAVNATRKEGVSQDQLSAYRTQSTKNRGPAGSVTQWRTSTGVITEHILKYGLHDVIMGNPIITLAAMNIFESARHDF